jgi:uncharacterized membrane protein
VSAAQRAGRTVLAHWLALANGLTAIFLALAFLAPVLLHLGQSQLADLIYRAYLLTCHEWPFRAYFLFGPQATYSAAELRASGIESIYTFRGSPELGYKVAFCARNVAIYAAILGAGLAYARLRPALPTLSFRGYTLLIAPMAIDGFSQLAGLRESTWELRTLTGVLFGAASVWLLYTRLDLLIAARLPTASRPWAAPSPAA